MNGCIGNLFQGLSALFSTGIQRTHYWIITSTCKEANCTLSKLCHVCVMIQYFFSVVSGLPLPPCLVLTIQVYPYVCCSCLYMELSRGVFFYSIFSLPILLSRDITIKLYCFILVVWTKCWSVHAPHSVFCRFEISLNSGFYFWSVFLDK